MGLGVPDCIGVLEMALGRPGSGGFGIGRRPVPGCLVEGWWPAGIVVELW